MFISSFNSTVQKYLTLALLLSMFCDDINAEYLFLIGDDRVLILEFSHDKAQVRLVVRNGPIEKAIVSVLVSQVEGFWEMIQLCSDVRPSGVCVTSSPEQSSLTRLQKLKRGSDRSTLYETCVFCHVY